MLSYIAVAFVILILAVGFTMFLNTSLFIIIQRTNGVVTHQTFHMQIMFYRAVVIQGTCMSVFFILPQMIIALCCLSVFKSVYFGIIAGGIQPLYIPFSYVLIILLIKPYRVFVLMV